MPQNLETSGNFFILLTNFSGFLIIIIVMFSWALAIISQYIFAFDIWIYRYLFYDSNENPVNRKSRKINPTKFKIIPQNQRENT
ncbi:MAG: hypothetical protein IPL26_12570 [Leptospiraceae bacterium]|nr:hypothetical protein [Leptospiraceae bacterium]